MAALLGELDGLIRLLEARLPADVNSAANQRMVEQLRRQLAAYFRDLEKAFPYWRVEQIYYQYAVQEG